ncbi:hypothetical protein LJR289_001631 [Pseudoduganella sp. LjRoot289]|uniref:hypothetical protein n=1 Tax=Pseudoduganella sp. LjRoot289 TaxID=3342314 RepID=UPI003ECDA771
MDKSISQCARWLLASGLLCNAAAMLLAPQAWYLSMPGVLYTGPFNIHFVRDIGCAYAMAGGGLLWRACRPATGAAAAIAGAGFLLMHALVHLGETLAGLCGWSQLLQDVPGVVLPALLAAGLALPPHFNRNDHDRLADPFAPRRL